MKFLATALPTVALVVISMSVSAQQAQPVTADKNHFSENSVNQLIDDVTEITSQAPGIDSAAIYEGFVGDTTAASFQAGVLGVPLPEVPPQMRELVRRGPFALRELIAHLDDTRPTKLHVGNDDSPNISRQVGVNSFRYSYFSDEYDPRIPQSKRGLELMEKAFSGRYTVKVADVCYVIIGQIVNRHLLAVRYQPSAVLVVNSPIQAPVLAQDVRRDWGNADAETLRASLLSDIRATNRPRHITLTAVAYTERFVNPALERLRLYFPDTYNALQGDDQRKKREFEARESEQQPPTR